MNKTIEEAAIEYAEQNYFREDDRYSFRENTDRSIKASAYAFEEGAGYIFSLPLRDRLTEEEKERVRYIRHEILCGCDSVPTGWDFTFQRAIRGIEEIFGEEMFNENKSE